MCAGALGCAVFSMGWRGAWGEGTRCCFFGLSSAGTRCSLTDVVTAVLLKATDWSTQQALRLHVIHIRLPAAILKSGVLLRPLRTAPSWGLHTDIRHQELSSEEPGQGLCQGRPVSKRNQTKHKGKEGKVRLYFIARFYFYFPGLVLLTQLEWHLWREDSALKITVCVWWEGPQDAVTNFFPIYYDLLGCPVNQRYFAFPRKRKVMFCLHFRNVGVKKRKNAYEVLLGI